MLKWIETTGKTERDAINAALEQLGLEDDSVSIEVITRAKTGFLGIGSCPAKIRVTYEVPDEPEEVEEPQETAQPEPLEVEGTEVPAAPAAVEPEPKQKPEPVEKTGEPEDDRSARIEEFLTGLLERLECPAEIKIQRNEAGIYQVELVGQNLGSLIGRRGETLDAIQQLTSYSVNRTGGRVRVQLDAENYREKREQSLQHLAKKVAGKVVKYRRSVTLEPMNAYERHVIHTALQEVPGVTTYSTGTEPNRRVIVAYDRDKK